METIAPTSLAQSWDNVGLLAGDPGAAARRALTCIDLTPDVVQEAIRSKIDLIVAYHPPIFRPVASLRADSSGTEAAVFRCIRAGVSIYATHTALDAAVGGTNDVMAALCGIRQTEPLEYVPKPGIEHRKLVVFVPGDHLDPVVDAIFAAGGGHIGAYSRCSYRSPGQGTFLGGESTNPSIGRKGRMECVEEVRLEVVVPSPRLPDAVRAMMAAHPYDEPAFDIYPLEARPQRGIGRFGQFARPTTLGSLARKLKRSTGGTCVQTVGPKDRRLTRGVIVVGAAGSLPFRTDLTRETVVVTGEMRHHDALSILRQDCCAIALGHWASERPILAPLAERLESMVPGLSVAVSKSDADPFHGV